MAMQGPISTRRKLLRRIPIILAVLLGFWLLSSFAVAYWATRRPHPIADEPVPIISWGTAKSFRIDTVDGQQLGAWFIDGQPEKPVILLLHGLGGKRQNSLKRAEMVASIGCPSLLISLRAHGDSTGNFNDFGYSAQHDVIAAVAWLEKNHPRRPVIVWGESMGAAAGVFAAETLGTRVQAYILESPYQDLRTATRNRTEYYLPPLLDRMAYVGLLLVSPLVLPDEDKISPLNAAAGVPRDTPVLILAGGGDRRARMGEALAIRERLGPRAELVVIDHADHGRLFQTDPETYRQAVVSFLGVCVSLYSH